MVRIILQGLYQHSTRGTREGTKPTLLLTGPAMRPSAPGHLPSLVARLVPASRCVPSRRLVPSRCARRRQAPPPWGTSRASALRACAGELDVGDLLHGDPRRGRGGVTPTLMNGVRHGPDVCVGHLTQGHTQGTWSRTCVTQRAASPSASGSASGTHRVHPVSATVIRSNTNANPFGSRIYTI